MKRPKQRQAISPEIRSKEASYDTENNPPRFSFRDIITNSKFSFDALEQKDKVNLINTLNVLGHLTWSEIYKQPRHKSGCETIDKEALKFALPSNIPRDCTILAFRFNGMAPMLGYKSAFGTFYILAFDPKFKAYKHG
jgi:hypothetical protein